MGPHHPERPVQFEAWREEDQDPPALVVQVGKTQLRYHLRAITDLHEMLVARRDWVPLGAADEQSRRPTGASRPGPGPTTTRSPVGTG